MQENAHTRNVRTVALALPALLFAFDRACKALIEQFGAHGTEFWRWGWFSITRFHNTAGPFSLPLSPRFLSWLTLGLLLVIFAALLRRPRAVWLWCLWWGGLSNFLDRMILGFTMDYLGLPFGGYWNVADFLILGGLLGLAFYRFEDEHS